MSSDDHLIYTKIRDLSYSGLYNIKCHVLTIYPWKESKGNDFVMTLKVADDPKENFIFVKIFNSKKYEHDFLIGDFLKIIKIRHFSNNFYILDKEGQISKLNKTNTSKNVDFPLRKIVDLTYSEYIKFIGILIYKQKETENLTILGFIDYTINPSIKKSENKAYYENNMILYVRVWDKLAKKALNLSENSVYCLVNLKIKPEMNRICSDLSDCPLSSISEVLDESIINEIKSRGRQPKDKIICFNGDLYKNNKLIFIKDIKDSGYYKIQVKILRHHPFNGEIIKICTPCGLIKTSKKCECGLETDEVFVVKYLVRDESGEIVLLCKNDIAKAMLRRCEAEKRMELLVYCEYRNSKMYYEVKDIPKLTNKFNT
ncbi:protection of telomeres protein 1 [Vairimorpha necatrix]|uniref:Protection of telomeres protein 1 n=1 Tax=Vairimorpha necatrix TaxID=6039 RepID=A0AAX4JCL7_9MICR